MSMPAPSPEALAHSERVAVLIRDEIGRAGGWIGFARYMETFWGLRGMPRGQGLVYGGAMRVLSADADHVELAFSRCLLAEMATAAKMGGMGVGNFPGCRGFRRRIHGWGAVLSAQYDFVDEERPGEPESGVVCCHRITRVPRQASPSG
ncbi:MAG: hypothetical protein HYU75_25105 [Betaproteobacteria bacterium]|nr:hypothetical protein [Betaproteobacteria bacterium]